ncbi:MAG: hypothetical protein NTV86_01225 [Planctomycetota bacterium]|nr:hypothetical protein [Planctomycetota bacterium]
MENKKAIIVVAVSVAVALVVLAGLRFWPENSSRLADKALMSAVDQAGKNLAAAESLLGNPTSEFLPKDGSPKHGPWAKDLPAALPEDPIPYLLASQLTEEQRTAQDAKWKGFIEAGKMPYRLMTAPTVNPAAMTKLAAARTQLQAALDANEAKGTPKTVALAKAKLGMAWLLTGRGYARQAALAGVELRGQLAQAAACLDAIAWQLEQADYYRQYKDKIAKGVDPKLNADSKTLQEDLKTKREAAESAAATLRQQVKDAQETGDRLRKEANEEKAAGAAGTGQGAAETTLKAIEKDKAASKSIVDAEALETKLAYAQNEIAELKIQEAGVAADLARDLTTQAQRDEAVASADKRLAELAAQTKDRQAELATVLADAAGWLSDKEHPVVPASEKRAEAAAPEKAPAAAATSEPASAPAPVAPAVKQAPANAGPAVFVAGVMVAQGQAREALVEAQKALDAAIPADGEDADGQMKAQANLDQGVARMAKASLALEGILLAEQVRALRDRVNQLLPDSEPAKNLERMAKDSLTPEAAVAHVPASSPASSPASAPADDQALAGANEWRDQAAKQCEEAAARFDQAVQATTETKVRWAGYTLAGLAWEKAYQLRAGRQALEGDLAKQNTDGMNKARDAAAAAVNNALKGAGGNEDRTESPFLAPALLLRERLKAIK